MTKIQLTCGKEIIQGWYFNGAGELRGGRERYSAIDDSLDREWAVGTG